MDQALAGVLLLLLVLSGLSPRFTALLALQAVPAAAVYFVALMIAGAVLSAPLTYYGGFVLPHRYGLSIQRLSGWLLDQAKMGGLSLAFGAGVVAVVYWIIASFPSVWWALAWCLVIVLSLILNLVFPIFIVPMMFKVRPLNNPELEQSLNQLAERARTRVRNIRAIELGAKLTAANAALMGWGSTRQIVLSDTLLQQYPPPEIEVVTAHELGHHVHGDTFRLFTMQSGMWLVGFYLTHLIFKASAAPPGFASISDVAAFPLLLLLFAAFSLATAPLTNAYRRHIEAAADEYALKLTGKPDSFIDAMTRLTNQNLSEAQPARWVELLLYDHPSYRKRVEMADRYAAQQSEQQRSAIQK